jgi:hypothetical protein
MMGAEEARTKTHSRLTSAVCASVRDCVCVCVCVCVCQRMRAQHHPANRKDSGLQTTM